MKDHHLRTLLLLPSGHVAVSPIRIGRHVLPSPRPVVGAHGGRREEHAGLGRISRLVTDRDTIHKS